MKKRSVKLILMAVVLLGAGLWASCSKSDDAAPVVVIPVDKAALTAAITAAKAVQAAAVEGPAAGQFQTGSKAVLQSSIDAAQSTVDNAATTQDQVTNAIASLATAVTSFNTKKIAEIDPTNLIAYWKFDEGSGTSAVDASGNSRNGTLMVGHSSLGGPIPTYGASNAAFSPTEITISLWAKLDNVSSTDCAAFLDPSRCDNGTFKDNYMISQNSYNGYKFQTQDGRFLYFTAKKTAAPDSYNETDANGKSLDFGTWYHLALTFGAGEMSFYINGFQLKQATGFGGFIALTDRFDFSIGQELPNAKVDPGISWTLPHFEGTMDEIRIYKKALTATQISSIYDQEKP
jgi:Concanavalin A-like lectin/glucanases superfamily